MELLLIRHALPERREVDEGPADPPLSAVGHRQAELMAEYLASERLDAVYASPLQRARQTAEPLARLQGLDIVIDDDVAESDRNASEYIPVEELKRNNDPRWQEILNGTAPGSTETPEEFSHRCVTAIERLIELNPSRRIAIVCHGGVINAYAAHVIGGHSAGVGFFYPNYTSIHRFVAARSGERSLVTLNETGFLRGTGLPMGLYQKG